MDLLIAMLTHFPPDQDRRAVETFAVQLDLLAYEARGQGAASETLAAIEGARVLVDLAHLPLPRLPSPASTRARDDVGPAGLVGARLGSQPTH